MEREWNASLGWYEWCTLIRQLSEWQERGKRHTSSGMLARKWNGSVCSVLIQVCFRDLQLEQTSSTGIHHIYNKHKIVLRCSAQTNQRSFSSHVCIQWILRTWKNVFVGKKLIPPSYAGSFKNTRLHQVIFKSHCRHIFCFIDPQIISVLSCKKFRIFFSPDKHLNRSNEYILTQRFQSTWQSSPTFSHTLDRSPRLCITTECGFKSSIRFITGRWKINYRNSLRF